MPKRTFRITTIDNSENIFVLVDETLFRAEFDPGMEGHMDGDEWDSGMEPNDYAQHVEEDIDQIDGTKEIFEVEVGYEEDKHSWIEREIAEWAMFEYNYHGHEFRRL